MIFHKQKLILNTALKLKIIRILCPIPCSMACVFYSPHHTPPHPTPNIQQLYGNWYPRPILNKKSISGIIPWIDFIWSRLNSWKYQRLVIFTGILSFTQSVNIPLPTNVIRFHSTIHVGTIPVLISYKCKYIWTWFKHMLWENTRGMNNCYIRWTIWKIRIILLTFTMPYHKIRQFGVQYMQFNSRNPQT